MLKKLIKLATVLSLLGASHIAYVQAFSFVVQRLRSARPAEDAGFDAQDSQTKLLSRDISREAFGPGHWTDSDKLLRYYNSHRGFFLYTLKFARPAEEGGVKFDGKRVTLEPAAVVLRSPDGKSTKTITSERAVIDFNQSFGFNLNKPNSEPTTVKFARLEQNVTIRDDRGTPDDPSDDLVIGPISYVDYDDETLQIRTDADVTLVDRDLRLTGSGLEIQLRAKDQTTIGATTHGSGFNGAQRAILKKNIHMLFADVGRAGLLPGTAKTTADAEGQVETVAAVDPQAAAAPSPNPNNEPTPLDLQCDGPMIVEMPSPPPPVEVGPPAPAAPTFVEFQRNVVVRRGKLSVDPDQLNCDTLHLTLLPGEPKPTDEAKSSAVEPQPVVAEAAPVDEEKSAFGGLTLRRVKASGHAVWLQLPGQGAKIRCVELLHHKDALAGKNTTIFHGGGPRKLWVEKRDIAQDGPDRGRVESVTHVWCADATLMDEGDMDRATLVANGPGLLESRAGAEPPRDVPPDRIVTWQDQLWLQNELDAANEITGKVLVLKGAPRVQDRTKGASLDARDSIVVWLNADEAKPAEAIKTADARDVVPAAFTFAEGEGEAAAPAQPAKKPAGLTIRRLLAVKDVHLVAPARDLRARDRLDVDFEEAKVTTTPPVGTLKPTAWPAPAADPGAKPKPPAEPALDPNAPANSNAGDQSANPPRPEEPLMTALADRAQAKVIVGSKAPGATADAENAEYEIRDVELRGGVALHQDPHPGKEKGLDATGEVLILLNEGPGKAIFDLYHHDPYSPKGRDADPETLPRARVSTDEMTIEGKVIGLNQKTNEAWVHGAGKLVQLTDRALLTDRATGTPEAGEPRADGGKDKTRAGKPLADKVPIVITWGEKMTFQGIATDPLNRPAAKAKFYKNARAEMRDALLYGGESITTYTDRPIPLAEAGKLNQKPSDANANANVDEPKPDLALIECEGGAVAISRKVDPDRPVLLGMQKITAGSLTYDRRSGGFVAPGPGLVYLYDSGGDPLKSQEDAASNAPIATSRVVRPIAHRPGEDDEKVAVRHADAARPAPERPQSLLPPLVLTQIKFEREMRGRLGTGKADDVTEQRWAEFFGGVQTARGEVPNEPAKLAVFDYDRLPPTASFMTSEMLRVVTEPPPAGEARNSGGRYFLKAWDNAYVTARDTTLQADVITYDSLNDLIYANGLDGRPVQIVQQAALGQPGSPLRVSAVRMNPRTGAADVIDPQALQLIDAHTGSRPKAVPPPNPNAPPPAPRPNRPKRPPVNPAEIRGFTGR